MNYDDLRKTLIKLEENNKSINTYVLDYNIGFMKIEGKWNKALNVIISTFIISMVEFEIDYFKEIPNKVYIFIEPKN